jgi:hypothetical protein
MKIVEAQSAVLSNYELYQHLTDQRDRYKQKKHRGPPTLETVVREVSPMSAMATAAACLIATQDLERLMPHRMRRCYSICALHQVP